MKLKSIKPAIIVFSLLIVASFSLFALADENYSGGQAVFKDTDQDGLSDDEEKIYGTDIAKADTDGDGYSDGVEVKSGYDPLKPAPGDKVVIAVPASAETTVAADGSSGDDNLTQAVSNKVADFIENNSNSSGEVNVETLDTILTDAVGSQLTDDQLPEVDDQTIKIKKQDYASLSEAERQKREKEDAITYLTSVAYIMASNAPQNMISAADISSVSQDVIEQASTFVTNFSNMSYFNDLADRGKLIMDQMSQVEVPESMISIHRKGLQLAKYALQLKEGNSINANDPIGMIVGLSKLQGLTEQASSFSQDVLTEFNKYGIDSSYELNL